MSDEPSRPTPDAAAPPWPQYASAVVELILDGEHLVLTPDDGADPSGAASLAPYGTPVWVLTAGDPYPVELDDEQNAARNARLREELDALGVRRDPALGRAPDGSVSERSIAVRCSDRAAVLAAAARHGQLAVYEIDDRIRCVDVESATVVTQRRFRLASAPAGSGRLVGPTGWVG